METLVGAATEILRRLAASRNIGGILHDNSFVKSEHRKDWIATLHKAQNFFKHAGKDPLGKLDYEPKMLHYFLVEACQLYRQMTHDPHFQLQPMIEAIAYEFWFSRKYPHLLEDAEALRKTLEGTRLQAFEPNDFAVVRLALGIRMPSTE